MGMFITGQRWLALVVGDGYLEVVEVVKLKVVDRVKWMEREIKRVRSLIV